MTDRNHALPHGAPPGWGTSDAEPADLDARGASIVGVGALVVETLNGDPVETIVVTRGIADVLEIDNDADGAKITGLGAPTVDADAATKKYVDDAIAAAIAAL